jgi:urea carboxylase-associated protein 2
MPTVPARDAEAIPAGVRADDLLWAETLEGGEYAAHRLPRGSVLRLCDVEGDACAHLVVHHADLPSERLNIADTTKVQWQMYLSAGSALLSDRGRVLMTMVADTSAHHDTLCGAPTRADHARKYGDGRVEGPFPNARDRLVVALAKFGLDRRDLPPSLGLFKGTHVGPGGELRLDAGPWPPGAHVDLRAEMDVLVSIANVPHVLDQRPDYTCTALRLVAWRGTGERRAEPATPEVRRALLNTDDWLLGM